MMSAMRGYATIRYGGFKFASQIRFISNSKLEGAALGAAQNKKNKNLQCLKLLFPRNSLMDFK